MTAEINTLTVRVDKASVETPNGSIDRERFESSLQTSLMDASALDAIESQLFSISGIVAADAQGEIGVVDFFAAVGSRSENGPTTARGVWFGCGSFEVSFSVRTTTVVDAACPDWVLDWLDDRGREVSVSDLFTAGGGQR
jgi:hypothetical protein